MGGLHSSDIIFFITAGIASLPFVAESCGRFDENKINTFFIMIRSEKDLVWKKAHVQRKYDGGRPINRFAKLISADGIG